MYCFCSSFRRLFLYRLKFICFFFFNDTATTEIYTLSLHDALPIPDIPAMDGNDDDEPPSIPSVEERGVWARSEEHTSELQSLRHLVCRLLLEKKKKRNSQVIVGNHWKTNS